MQLPAQLLCDINGPRHILPSKCVSLFALVLGMRYCHARVLLTSSAMSNTSCQRPAPLRASRKLIWDMPTHQAIVMPQLCKIYNTAVPSKHTTTSDSGEAARSSAESKPAGMNSKQRKQPAAACPTLLCPHRPTAGQAPNLCRSCNSCALAKFATLKAPAYLLHAPASCAPFSWTSAQDVS